MTVREWLYNAKYSCAKKIGHSLFIMLGGRIKKVSPSNWTVLWSRTDTAVGKKQCLYAQVYKGRHRRWSIPLAVKLMKLAFQWSVSYLHYFCSTVILGLLNNIFAKARDSTGVCSPGLRHVLTAQLPITNQTVQRLSFTCLSRRGGLWGFWRHFRKSIIFKFLPTSQIWVKLAKIFKSFKVLRLIHRL